MTSNNYKFVPCSCHKLVVIMNNEAVRVTKVVELAFFNRFLTSTEENV